MIEALQAITAIIVASAFVISLSYLVFVIDLRVRIKKYNKKHPEHMLDVKTNYMNVLHKYDMWYLEMFCDPIRKENNENEK